MKMIVRIILMPKFDPMSMVLDSKSVAGFNLSFFAEETELIEQYMEQILQWVKDETIQVPKVTVYSMEEIGLAHEYIQSGKSIGKIVIRTSR
jgi:NADPH:quinone reductase-like Zn-dependent oxidoreductase